MRENPIPSPEGVGFTYALKEGEMNGKWIVRKPEDHKCSMPDSYSVFGEGSIWECECGQQWKWSGGWWTRVVFRRRLKENSNG